MNWIKGKYNGFSAVEKKQVLMLLFFGVVAGYLFYAATTWQMMFQIEKLANRKADRIEKRIGDFKPPELEHGISKQVLSKLVIQLKKQELSLQEYAAALLPVGDAAAREALKLELTQLAYANQLRLSRMQTSELRSSIDLSSLSGTELRGYLQGRPTFKLALSGQFMNLVRFVEGLDTLSYQIYVTDMNVELLNEQNSLLSVELELRI